jgi:hypothetical protein
MGGKIQRSVEQLNDDNYPDFWQLSTVDMCSRLRSKFVTTKELSLIKPAFEMNVSEASEVKTVQEWHMA